MILIDKLLDKNTKYGDIFEKTSEIKLTNKYRELCKLIHPDVCNDTRSTDAFSQLQRFYQEAQKALKNKTWAAANYIEILTTKNTTLQIKYLYHCRFEIGDYYVCKNVIIYIFDSNREKYYLNYKKQINNLKYADRNMEKVFSPLFPTILQDYKAKNGKYILVIKKTADVYPLKCLIENGFDNDLPHTHLAWITSRLMNIACYLKYNEIVSNGIDIDNIFVSPQYHSILLLGGWWYTTKKSENMIGTTKHIFDVMTPKTKANKKSDYVTDIESIKSIGRQYMNDAPSAIKNFYNKGSKSNAMEEMEDWDKALEQGYGKRKFIKIDDAIINKIYK